MKQQVSRFLRL